MADEDAIMRALRHRIYGMKEEAKLRHRPGLKQQLEELEYLVEMLERRLDGPTD